VHETRSLKSLKLSTGGGLLAVVLWSTTIAMARSLSEQVGPLTAAASSCLLGGLFCALRVVWRNAPARRFSTLSKKYLFICGFLFVAYEVLIFLAVGIAQDREQLLEVALINYLWPVGTILLSTPLLNKRANILLFPGTALAMLGVFLVITHGTEMTPASFLRHLQTNPTAFVLAFVAAILWALYSTLTRRWSTKGGHGAVDVFLPVAGCVLLLLRLICPESTTWSLQAAAEATVLGCISGVAYWLWDTAMRKGNVVFVAACSYFTPLLSSIISCAYLKIVPGPRLWIGCVLIVLGSLISWRSVADLEKTFDH
jgi:drug/metabolite transporter (DMT)-like permease